MSGRGEAGAPRLAPAPGHAKYPTSPPPWNPPRAGNHRLTASAPAPFLLSTSVGSSAAYLFRKVRHFQHWRLLLFLLALLGILGNSLTGSLDTSRLIPANVPWRTDGFGRAEDAWSFLDDFAPQAAFNAALGDNVRSAGALDWPAGVRRTTAPSKEGLSGNGPKTSFRTNLRGDRQYLLSLPSGHEAVLSICNGIYLALLSDRIPILPAFAPPPPPSGKDTPAVAAGYVYDLAHLSHALGNRPIIEAHELKAGGRRLTGSRAANRTGGSMGGGEGVEDSRADKAESAERDKLGCWRAGPGLADPLLPFGEITVDYTPIPRTLLPLINPGHPSLSTLADLLRTYRPAHPAAALDPSGPTPISPETHVACLDTASALQIDPGQGDLLEEWKSGEGVWARVGKYLRFQPGLIRMADEYVRVLIGVGRDQPVPPYMAVHIPRESQISPQQWAYRVQHILEEVQDRRGLTIEHVLISTDEADKAVLKRLRKYGFTIIDHKQSKTIQRLDQWFPTLLDSAILSSSSAFLGMGDNAMSVLAYRRVINWGAGAAYLTTGEVEVPAGWTWHLRDFVLG